MKRCHFCGRTYANEVFAFCPIDGSVLSASFETIAAETEENPHTASYPSRNLVFKRGVIDRLGQDDRFAVVTPEGTFSMTKAEFLRVFSNVAESPTYRNVGNYSYSSIPKKAFQFLTNSDPGKPEVVDRVSCSPAEKRTAAEILRRKRRVIVDAFGSKMGVNLDFFGRVFCWNTDRTFRVVCVVSKQYQSSVHPLYWYAYHPKWHEFLEGATRGFYVAGCMGIKKAFAIPFSLIESELDNLNQTVMQDGRHYWHIRIIEAHDGDYVWKLKSKRQISLTPFEFPVVER